MAGVRGGGMADGVTGGQLLVDALDQLGVERLFSVSGGCINPIYLACAQGELVLHHVRHESAAGFMAEATYRATGRAGVAVVTLGPGVTNTVTPCISASLAGVPMLVVGGQVPAAVLDKGAGMAVDTLSVMSTVTKWAVRVGQVERIPEYVAEAWRRMHAPTAGPVYLEVPADVLAAQVSRTEADRLIQTWVRPQPRQAIRPDAASLTRAAEVLQGSARTLVLVGDDCFHSSGRAQVEQFVEWCGAAFATLRLARGLLADADPRCIGPGYVPCNPVLQHALTEADTVVLLGHHWEFDLEFGSGIGAQTTVVQVLPDPARVGSNGRVDVPVVASVGGFLAALTESQGESGVPLTGDGRHDRSWVEQLAADWDAHCVRTVEDAAPPGPSADEVDGTDAALHPVTLVRAVEAAVPQGTTFVTSHGNVDFWADEVLSIDGVSAYLRAGQSGTLGAEVPYGVAAALTQAGPCVVFVGDGGIGYAVAELDTAARYGANVLVVVADDQQWAAIALPQARQYGQAIELGLPGRDWVAVAEGLGARARRAETVVQVQQAVRELLSGEGPALLHVPIRAVESPYMIHISR
ncbi:MAG: thiamine pyrophosphate-binding protein [Candidatus Dormibacteria bacterium]